MAEVIRVIKVTPVDGNNAICSVDVFTLIMSLVHLARRERIDRAFIESTATCSTKQHHK